MYMYLLKSRFAVAVARDVVGWGRSCVGSRGWMEEMPKVRRFAIILRFRETYFIGETTNKILGRFFRKEVTSES